MRATLFAVRANDVAASVPCPATPFPAFPSRVLSGSSPQNHSHTHAFLADELVSKYGGRNNVMLEGAPTTRVPPNLVTAEERGKVHYTIPQFLASDDPSPERRRMQPAPGREAYGRAYTKKGDINGPVNVPLPKLDSPADVV